MSFSVIFHPSPDDQYDEIENEFQEHAQRLRKSRKLFVDPEFPHNKDSIGTNIHETEDFIPVAWWAPHQLINNLVTSHWKIMTAMFNYIENNQAMRAKDPDFEQDSNVFEKGLDNCNKIKSTKWSVYDNPWPFHVGQGNLTNSWLLAPLMCIARRKEILEHVLPDRDYTKDCGMVQVRLFINGQWEVLKLDYFIPKSYGTRTIYANIIQCQLWVAFIEKAFAKVKGSYGNLNEGSCEEAFTCLTGCPSRSQQIDKEIDPIKFWEELMGYHSNGYLLAAKTGPCDVEEDDLYSNREYSILDVKEHDGNRMILIGNSCIGNDKEDDDLPAYEEEISSKFDTLDKSMVSMKLFWMEITHFIRHFDLIYVCEYQKKWYEKRFLQTVERKNGNVKEWLVLRLNIQERQEVIVEVSDPVLYERIYFMGIYKATSDNQCGDLVEAVHDLNYFYSSGPMFLEPGSYFVVLTEPYNRVDNDFEWVIKSSIPLNSPLISFDRVDTCLELTRRNVHSIIGKYGKREKVENNENLMIYQWVGSKWGGFVMAENRSRDEYFKVKVPWIDPGVLPYFSNRPSEGGVWFLVPPNSRCIVAKFSCCFFEYIGCPIEWQHISQYKNPIDWRNLKNMSMDEFFKAEPILSFS